MESINKNSLLHEPNLGKIGLRKKELFLLVFKFYEHNEDAYKKKISKFVHVKVHHLRVDFYFSLNVKMAQKRKRTLISG